jgi:hypothetical protein
MHTVSVDTWVNGNPVTVESFTVANRATGFVALREIARSGDYDVCSAGYLHDSDGNRVAILNIYSDGRTEIVTER